ncbi:type II toxin-antitoxin system RelE/ParE family toxin [Bdellovibrio bacteriovorus]|uniref:type II toxin-antitoxin system RelE/ParE family toxin n=1 Tax=Bdellovibrio bacteriovorus TaxID=959 RepID=UPI0021D377E9|nr:type II toxin-antitoxin system RelE/ParE family toxin [Bdellovibrio bacteriovorus]UXR65869.1 type II toxin-antitoxin system RelE/ParE family toxin [Bdellovibrio bacteriovorus]
MKPTNLTKCPKYETLKKIKAAEFHPKVKDIVSAFPVEVKRALGKAIFDLQKGAKLRMPLSKPMASVGAGVEELRIKDASGAYRVFYLARFADSILVFHAFQKKTEKTPSAEIRTGQKRLKEMISEKS